MFTSGFDSLGAARATPCGRVLSLVTEDAVHSALNAAFTLGTGQAAVSYDHPGVSDALGSKPVISFGVMGGDM